MPELDLANPRRLKVFLEVADHLSFSQAARRLYLTQPAVSKHIKELERVVGTQLFDHRKRNLSLTEAGHSLYEYARKMIALADEMEATMQGANGTMAGRVVVGGTDVLENSLPDVLIDFRLAHPQVALTLRFGPSRYICDMLLDHRLGLGVVLQNPRDARLEVTTLAETEVELKVVTPPGHPLAEREVVEPKVLEEYPFVQYPPLLPGYIDSYLQQLGVKPRYVMEIESMDGIKRAVERGVGISLLPVSAMTHESPARFVQLKLKAPLFKTAWLAVRNKYRHLTTAERAVLNHVISKYSGQG